MRFFVKTLSYFMLLFLSHAPLNAASQTHDWYKDGAGDKVIIYVDMFLATTCPHCHKADEYFETIAKKRPWLKVRRYFIDQDKNALKQFYQRQQELNIHDFSVPAIFFCKTHWLGFDQANTTGNVLLRALDFCHEQLQKKDTLNSTALSLLQEWSGSNQVSIQSSEGKASDPVVIVLMALVDVLNPCSLFALTAFLAFLWLYSKPKKDQMQLGLAFILTWGLLHFVSNTHPVLYFTSLNHARIPTALVGLLLLIYVVKTAGLLRLERVIHPGLRAFTVLPLSAISIFAYQQRCSLNIGLLFDQWLSEQNLTPIMHGLYQLFYEVVYLSLPLLFLIFHTMLMRPRLSLQIAACLNLFIIGGLLIVYPTLLSGFWLSFMVLIGSMMFTWIMMRGYGRRISS